MTLIFDRRDGLPDGPQMHALVIGVGRFPHVATSVQADRQACPDSARAMVRFLLDHCDDFTAPLATIECLLSDPKDILGEETYPRTDHDPRDTDAVDRGTHVAVAKACKDWSRQCRKGDVLFFYGASHGLATTSETGLLVCEDYKSDPSSVSYGVLSVESIAFCAPAVTKAAASWIFLDACQELSHELNDLKYGPSLLRPLEMTVTDVNQWDTRSVSVVGSLYGREAHADKEGVAYFTEALIESLSGCCVRLEGDEWYVTGAGLSGRIQKMSRIRYNHPHALKTSSLGGSNEECRLLRACNPRAPVAVSTWPETKMARARSAEIVKQDTSRDVVAVKADSEMIWRCSVSLATTALQVEVVPDAGPPLVKSFTLKEDGVEVKLP